MVDTEKTLLESFKRADSESVERSRKPMFYSLVFFFNVQCHLVPPDF